MFGMSWPEIAIIIAVGMFVLGPERIPVAVKWVGSTLKTVRTMAAGAQEQLRGEFGPEIDELRRQIADLQSLKEIQELRALRDLNPRSMITKNLLGDEFSGGVKGLLGLDGLTDMIKPTGSGVADEAPAVDLGKAVQFNGPTADDPVDEQPVVHQPAPIHQAVQINDPGRLDDPAPVQIHPVTLDLSKSNLNEPDPVAVPRHAAPSAFDMDAT
ncbi:Sec-independent protein translocase protein TatB [Nakamurella sp. PAMC28650]|uniref:Sec-independent protein translocase protein TatB n=1 Tax=Nakamurella sp. PAMC28650 TaxID=2762325 RepID=UPI00164E488D|nr:Sec-independent protein translocase protein TatB [Nakamurella sp. PAMC28650]QNK80121.1 twin-arginine translocase subunit TatB [Nakamurella sp. PAMC28650]